MRLGRAGVAIVPMGGLSVDLARVGRSVMGMLQNTSFVAFYACIISYFSHFVKYFVYQGCTDAHAPAETRKRTGGMARPRHPPAHARLFGRLTECARKF